MKSQRPTGARGLRFSAASHRYWIDGDPVPGVTTILGVLDKPAIPRWAATQVAEYVADHPDAVEHLRAMGRGPMIQALKGVPWEKRDKAATRGTSIHDYAERLLKGDEVDVDEELVPVIENALTFLDEWHIEPLIIEAPVGSREHRYAGTADLFARYRRPDTAEEGIGIFDWKSGKALYPEFAWQLAAYAGAEFMGLSGDEEPVPVTDAAFGVQVRPDGYDVAPLAHGPDVFAEFLTIRRTHEVVTAGRGDWRRPGSGHVGIFVQSDAMSSGDRRESHMHRQHLPGNSDDAFRAPESGSGD